MLPQHKYAYIDIDQGLWIRLSGEVPQPVSFTETDYKTNYLRVVKGSNENMLRCRVCTGNWLLLWNCLIRRFR